MKHISLIIFIALSFKLSAQTNDSIFIRSIYNEALSNVQSYEDLRHLCKDVGARLSGSAEAQMAVEWSERTMQKYGFDKVYLQEIKVPHWERMVYWKVTLLNSNIWMS